MWKHDGACVFIFFSARVPFEVGVMSTLGAMLVRAGPDKCVE